MWEVWKDTFLNVIYKHAPLRKKRIGKKGSPWNTADVLSKIHKRDYLLQKAKLIHDEMTWRSFRVARNEANNKIKQAKPNYFKTNLEQSKNNPKKTWKLINEVSSRQGNKSKLIPEINFDYKIATTPEDIAEAFNCHFTRIGKNLASKIAETQNDPISYLKPVNKVFAFSEIEILDVNRSVKKINARKAAGLDNIPCYLLKRRPTMCHLL